MAVTVHAAVGREQRGESEDRGAGRVMKDGIAMWGTVATRVRGGGYSTVAVHA